MNAVIFLVVLAMAALCAWLVFPLLGMGRKESLGLAANSAEIKEMRLALIQVEDDHAAARISEEDYRAQRARIETRLGELDASGQ